MSKEALEEFKKVQVEVQIRGADDATIIQLLTMALVTHMTDKTNDDYPEMAELSHFDRTMLDEAYKRIKKAGHEMPAEYVI